MLADVCVVCGSLVPEGRQICPECALRPVKKKENSEKPTVKKLSVGKRKKRS